MRLLMLFSMCVCGLLFTVPSMQTGGWRGIVPLHSNRTDVERIFGKPNFKYDLYDFEKERVSILYSEDPCTGGLQGSYNVPRDTVISIDIAPKQKLLASDLGFDLRKFKKSRDPVNEVHSFYRNEEEGITIGTYEGGGDDNGKVLKIYYGPAARDNQLRCSASTTQSDQQINSNTGPISDPCPAISITGSLVNIYHHKRYSFSATLAGMDPAFKPIYKWRVSTGTITRGQGTYKIEVDAHRVVDQSITATLEVGGVIPEGCQKIASYTMERYKPNSTMRN